MNTFTTPSPRHRLHRTRTFIRSFLEGLRTPWDGFLYMGRHPALWKYGWAALLLNLLLTTAILLTLFLAGASALAYLHTLPYFAHNWWGRIQELFLAFFLILASLATALTAYLLVGSILISHFNARLARRVELQLGLPPELLRSIPLRYQILDALRSCAIILTTTLASTLLGCLPLAGAIIGGALALYIYCFIFGFLYLEIPLELRGMRLAQARAFAKKHRAHTLGLGLTVFIANLIPLLGPILLTTAATGAVLLHRKLTARDPAKAPLTTNN